MTIDLPLSARVEIWRKKVLDGTITIEEMREAVEAIRQGRVTAAATAAKSRSSARAAPIDSDALLDDLENLK